MIIGLTVLCTACTLWATIMCLSLSGYLSQIVHRLGRIADELYKARMEK